MSKSQSELPLPEDFFLAIWHQQVVLMAYFTLKIREENIRVQKQHLKTDKRLSGGSGNKIIF